MTEWTRDRVLEAAGAWVWVPEDAREAVTEEYHLVAYPEWYSVPAQVARCRSERAPDAVFDEVVSQFRDWGVRRFGWWVSESSRPRDLEDHLVERGATLSETVSVLGFELAGGVPDLGTWPGVSVQAVRDERTLRAAHAVVREVWGGELPGEDEMSRQLTQAGRPLEERNEFRVVAFVGDEPAAAGGCTRVDGVARLWSAATRGPLRGRGAYRAVLAERLRIARALGSELALVKGRVSTSGPILRRAGFGEYGEERFYTVTV